MESPATRLSGLESDSPSGLSRFVCFPLLLCPYLFYLFQSPKSPSPADSLSRLSPAAAAESLPFHLTRVSPSPLC